MDAPVDHLLADLIQLPGHGAIVNGIADAQHDAADQGGVDRRMHLRVAA